MTHICGPEGQVHAYLLEVMTALRREFAARLKLMRTKFPNYHLPCETCAFRTSTDTFEGFDQTTINFVAALCEGPAVPFWCHHDMRQDKTGQWIPPKRLLFIGGKKRLVPDERRMMPCAAWSVLISTLPEPIDITRYIPYKPMRDALIQMGRGKP